MKKKFCFFIFPFENIIRIKRHQYNNNNNNNNNNSRMQQIST